MPSRGGAGAETEGEPCTGTPSVAQRFVKCVPPGDERERNVCDTCGYVEYVNPKVVVGCLPCYVRETPRVPDPPSSPPAPAPLVRRA